jgi:hypothetical protein
MISDLPTKPRSFRGVWLARDGAGQIVGRAGADGHKGGNGRCPEGI